MDGRGNASQAGRRPPPSPFDNVVLPTLTTRKALLVLDLQNDFVLADGALPAPDPDGYVGRAVDEAKAFRKAGVRDVIWVRSVFEGHRPAGDEQIVTRATAPAAASRGEKTPLGGTGQRSRGLSQRWRVFAGAGQRPAAARVCAGRTRRAASWWPEVAAVRGREARSSPDLKSHYSAFESSQLLMRLRARDSSRNFTYAAL